MHSLLGKGNVLSHTKALDPIRSTNFVKVFRGRIQVNAYPRQRVNDDRNICVDVRQLTHIQIETARNNAGASMRLIDRFCLSAEFRHILTLTTKLLNDVLLAGLFCIVGSSFGLMFPGTGVIPCPLRWFGEQQIFVTVVNCLMRLMGRCDEILRVE